MTEQPIRSLRKLAPMLAAMVAQGDGERALRILDGIVATSERPEMRAWAAQVHALVVSAIERLASRRRFDGLP